MTAEHEEGLVLDRSRELFLKAKQFLPGGVTGDGRSAAPFPVLMSQGKGKHLIDVDGNEYLDFHGGFGTAILGYAHPEVDSAVKRAIDEVGAFVGTPHPYEGALAERLCSAMPGVERVAFCGGGGSDAVYHCIRLSRAATGRSKIVKLEGGYHGWHSDVALNTRPKSDGEDYRGRPQTQPSSLGILPSVVDEVEVVTINDQQALVETFDEFGPQIAAFILEPVVYSAGCITVDTEFLQLARKLCTKHGVVLVFDEVMSGFRNGIGGAADRQGVVGDLAAYGKAVANGHMMSFLGGSEELMSQLSPEGGVLYSGTFNGHPVSMAAAQATLDVIERERVPEKIWAVADDIALGINEAVQELGAKAVCQSYGSVWNLYFNADAITNYRELAAATTPDVETMNDAFRAFLRERGVYVHKRHVNRCFVSAQHDSQDVDRTVSLVAEFIEAHLEQLAA